MTDGLIAVLLGFVEGLTEFIPVSSTGHLILLVDLLGFQGPPGRVFEVVIQLGAILAVCFHYRERLWWAGTRFAFDPGARRLVVNLVAAFAPAVVIGVLAHDFIKSVLFSPWVVCTSLVVGGIAILVIERLRPRPDTFEMEGLSVGRAFRIGLCQTVAMIPGVSRSGATIMGALLLRVDRKAATEFSFFLAIPTMLGAVVYDLYKNREALAQSSEVWLLGVGFAAAFVAALLTVRTVIGFVSRHGFVPFAYYRIVLGVVMMTILMLAG